MSTEPRILDHAQWPVVRLDEVAELCLGKMLDAQKNRGTPYPYLRNPNVRWFGVDISDIREMPFEDRELNRFGLRDGDVVVCEGGEAGRAAIWDGRVPEMKFQKAIHRVRCGSNLFNRFLVYRLKADYDSGRLADYYTGATIKHLTGQDLARYRFALPSLPEQRRIAAILDQAEALRAKRKGAIARLDAVDQSIFMEMFGDPLLNPRKWPRKNVAEVGSVVTGNTPSRARSDYYGNSIEWIKSDNLNTPDYYVTRAEELLSERGRSVARLAPPEAILVTCIAGTPACIGNAAMADREVAFNQQINALIPVEVDPHFLYGQIRFGKRLVQLASTNGMKGMVSKSRFEQIELMYPPLDLQRRYGYRALQLERVRGYYKKSIASLDTLFSSLLHRAFCGEL